MFILTFSCFQEDIRRSMSATGITFKVPCVCLVETFSCFQPVFIGSGQFPWPEFITSMLLMLMTLIQYTVNSGIFACVCEANTCKVGWTSHILQAWHDWEAAVVDAALCLVKYSGTQDNERQCKNVKYYNYSSRIIAKSLLLFSYAGTCAALLI